MNIVTVRELRNQGGDVLDRVARGDALTVTRDGAPVARLEPLGRRSLPSAELVARRKRLPVVDADALRRDIDTVIDATL